jgi:hypothetical protein
MTIDNPRRSQECPVASSQQDRRDFLKLAAAIPAALATTQVFGVDAQSDTAKPADAALMPQISLGKYSISRLIVGCHDIDGGSHMSPFLDREMHDY